MTNVSFAVPEDLRDLDEAGPSGTKFASEGMKPSDKRVQQLRGGRGRSGSQRSEDSSVVSKSETGTCVTSRTYRAVDARSAHIAVV